ncbi:MAG TPA: hypothetical protein VIR58_02290, partial [Acidimicrobiales bacterium]
VLAAAVLLAPAACSDDGTPGEGSTGTSVSPSSTSSTSAPTATTVRGDDGTLDSLLLGATDLPAGFEESSEGVDETITSFCAGEDATAGLQASARAVRAFARTPPGASVLQVVFDFEGTGAADFVAAADGILERCSDVPDATGLAFAYEPLAPAVAAPLEGVEQSTGRYGVSAGSGSLTIDVAVFRTGSVGQLVAVLGLDLPREELDALAAQAFTAAVARTADPSG